MNKYPLVSIIITSYNRANLIGKAIESALVQDYPNFEVVISDNASTDNTDEVISGYSIDSRIRYFKNATNIGMIPNFKKATNELARGEYLTYISSDDYLINNNFLSNAIDLFNKGDNLVVVFGQVTVLNTITNITTLSKPADHYSKNYRTGTEVLLNSPKTGNFGWGAAFFKTDVFMSVDPYSYSNVMALDSLINFLLLLKGNVGFIQTPSYCFCIQSNQASNLKTAKAIIDNFEHIQIPYKIAKQNHVLNEAVLDKWKNDISYRDLRNYTLSLAILNRQEYKKLVTYAKENHLQVYERLKKDVKWNVLLFFYKHPGFSLYFFKRFSSQHYNYLTEILQSDKPVISSER